MLSLFVLYIVNENYLKHLPTGDRSLEVVMFTKRIPGTFESWDAGLAHSVVDREEFR